MLIVDAFNLVIVFLDTDVELIIAFVGFMANKGLALTVQVLHKVRCDDDLVGVFTSQMITIKSILIECGDECCGVLSLPESLVLQDRSTKSNIMGHTLYDVLIHGSF